MDNRPTGSAWDDAPPEAIRVLVECPDYKSPSVIAELIERDGYAVRVCGGPDRDHSCPMVTERSCTLVNGADVVVNLLSGPDRQPQAVIGAITSERRPPQVVTQMPTPTIARRNADDDWDFDRDRVTILSGPLSSAAIMEGIQAALRRRDRPQSQWGDH